MAWGGSDKKLFNLIPELPNNMYKNTFIFSKVFAILFSLVYSTSCQKGVENRAPVQLQEEPLFVRHTSAETGIKFNNVITEDRNRNIIRYQGYYDGGGVAAADFNNDGLTDLFFVSNMYQNLFYVNKGDFHFEDQTMAAGLKEVGFGWYTGVTVVDINNDGWMDIYLCKSGKFKPENRRNLLYVNNGNLTFTERAAEYGLDHAGYSTHAAFFDYDKDGDLDMYLTNYGVMKKQFKNEETLRLRTIPDEYSGDKLFENRNGEFADITSSAGIAEHQFGFAHSVGIGDFNSDGWEDIYVCNDFFEADYLYYNTGKKTFREGLMNSMNHISNFSMGNDVSDFNNDGLLDIVVLDMVAEDNRRLKENMSGMDQQAFSFFVNLGFHYQYMFNMLHKNNGNGTFSEIAHLAGISNTDWSWAPLLADFDNDGYKDIYITNGLKRDARNLTAKYTFEDILAKAAAEGRNDLTEEEWKIGINAMPSEKLKNYMYRNRGDMTFEKMTDRWGLGIVSFSNGAVYTDLDNDGDLDLVVNNINDEAFVFENKSAKSNYLRINLIGPDKNIAGLGTKVEIYHEGRHQMQQFYPGHGYRSSIVEALHFGLGKSTLIDSIYVTWTDGKRQLMKGMQSNETITANYADANSMNQSVPERGAYFRDAPSVLTYLHRENEYDDFLTQALLPYKLSATGPIIEKGDVNEDGLEDILIGGSKGFSTSLYLQHPDGGFTRSDQPAFAIDRECVDGGAAFFDVDNDGDMDLYVASGGNEYAANSDRYKDRLYINNGKGLFGSSEDRIPELNTSNSSVVPIDFDGDGDIDLFVGGRLFPDKYPLPVRSYLLENRDGSLIDVTAEKASAFEDLGMVTTAVSFDFDMDNDPDLVIGGEWMPVTVFENLNGTFTNATKKAGLEQTSGWWQKIVSADFDGDGDIDIVAGNLGLNSKYKASQEAPLEVFAGDLDENGVHDIVLAYWQHNKLYPVRDRMTMIRQFPFIEINFPTFESFAAAQISEIFPKEMLDRSIHLKATCLSSSYLENLGNGKFQIHWLPNEAQVSPINTILPYDVDFDGSLDIIIAGNIYQMETETVRNDAGYGMFLKGNNKGNFIAVPYSESQLSVGGDVKGGVLVKRPDKSPICFVVKNIDNIQATEIIESVR